MSSKKSGKPIQTNAEVLPAMYAKAPIATTMYADSPAELNFTALQQNLQKVVRIHQIQHLHQKILIGKNLN